MKKQMCPGTDYTGKTKGEGRTFTFKAENITCLLSGFYPFI
jgi:hypothetical protein